MKLELEATVTALQKRVQELEGYIAYQDNQLQQYRELVKTLEGKLNGKSTRKPGKNSKKQSDRNEH